VGFCEADNEPSFSCKKATYFLTKLFSDYKVGLIGHMSYSGRPEASDWYLGSL